MVHFLDGGCHNLPFGIFGSAQMRVSDTNQLLFFFIFVFFLFCCLIIHYRLTILDCIFVQCTTRGHEECPVMLAT